MNKITLAGVIDSEIMYSHTTKSEKFNAFYLCCARESGALDIVKCVISDLMSRDLKENDVIEMVGEIRTMNYDGEDGKRHMDVYVFVNEVLEYTGKDKNYVEVEGFVCKEPVYRETPLRRKICILHIACHRRVMKSDYLPCLAWGRNAIKASIFNIGDKVILSGRLQSREYTKKLDDGKEEIRVAYEVSANNVNVIDEEYLKSQYSEEDA